MSDNPFRLPLPAVSDVSGGRTSAMMLRRVLDAYGGAQPPGLHLLFCNTGKERNETLDFVHDLETRWQVDIKWLEYRYLNGRHDFAVVSYETASRKGEPFEQVIRARNEYRAGLGKPPMLPNPVMRFCTGELKVRTKRRYLTSVGLTNHRTGYHHAVGLRADEWSRVYRLTKACARSDESGIVVCPLAEAGITEQDVMSFWAAQDFDLRLQSYEGNCDLCFLKNNHKISRLITERPQNARWWMEQELSTGAVFRRDRPAYARLVYTLLVEKCPLPMVESDEMPCHCTD